MQWTIKRYTISAGSLLSLTQHGGAVVLPLVTVGAANLQAMLWKRASNNSQKYVENQFCTSVKNEPADVFVATLCCLLLAANSF